MNTERIDPRRKLTGPPAPWRNLPIAVLGHEISEFVVIGSGLRTLRG